MAVDMMCGKPLTAQIDCICAKKKFLDVSTASDGAYIDTSCRNALLQRLVHSHRLATRPANIPLCGILLLFLKVFGSSLRRVSKFVASAIDDGHRLRTPYRPHSRYRTIMHQGLSHPYCRSFKVRSRTRPHPFNSYEHSLTWRRTRR